MKMTLRVSSTFSLLLILSGCQATKDLTSNFTSLASRSSQPVIQALPSEYQPSLLAIGKERDVNDYRAQGEGLVPIPALTKYLNDLLTKIKKETGIANLPGTVYVTSNEGLDAFATPDENIFLGIGFLKNLETEDQIVAILAHELAHIIYGHHESDMVGNLQKQLQQTAALGAQVHANLNAGGTATAALSKNSVKYLQQMQLLIAVTDIALLPAWSRKQEDEADALAIDLATKMGYSYSRGMKSMLELLSTEEERVDKKKAEKDALLHAQFEKDFKDGNLKLDKVFANVWGTMKSQLSSKHDAAVLRISTTAEYYEKFYADSPQKTRVHKTEWAQIMKNKSVAQTIVHYKLAYEADDLRIAGQNTKALQLARKAVNPPTANHPFTLRVLAETQLALGDQKGFSNTFAKSASSPEPSWNLIQLKANDEFIKGRKTQAKESMEKGFQYFKEPPSLRPVMIGFYERIGDSATAKRMKTDCAFRSLLKHENCSKDGK
ncbi:M48 family metallopeptidase [Herminiimonas sp. NPDC097707]|uniref:M48 family metallopeptidase n=1 Tax=Herminiimonas sp. NPDC097707 TaxID=3364007 RepID=UPI00383A12A7